MGSYFPTGESYLGEFKSFPVQFHFRKSHKKHPVSKKSTFEMSQVSTNKGISKPQRQRLLFFFNMFEGYTTTMANYKCKKKCPDEQGVS